MDPRDARFRELAARLMEASYEDDPPPSQRAVVLDRLCAAPTVPPPPPRDEALRSAGGRALEVVYATPSPLGQRAEVLDVIEEANPLRQSMRAPREGALAALSTLAAACVVVAVAVGLHDEARPPWLHLGLPAWSETSRPDLVRAQETVHATPVVVEAVNGLRNACEAGDALSCRRVGTLYQRGRGVGASAEQATGYFERACRAGDARACLLRDAVRRRGLVDQLNKVDQDDILDAEYFSTLGL